MNLFTRITCLSLLLIALGALVFDSNASAENTVKLGDVTISESLN